MEHLGKVFREFRTSGNYSLKEAAGESCSTSQLSRFELGESDLAVSRFFEILDKLSPFTTQMILQVFKSFKKNNLKRLKVQQIPSILS